MKRSKLKKHYICYGLSLAQLLPVVLVLYLVTWPKFQIQIWCYLGWSWVCGWASYQVKVNRFRVRTADLGGRSSLRYDPPAANPHFWLGCQLKAICHVEGLWLSLWVLWFAACWISSLASSASVCGIRIVLSEVLGTVCYGARKKNTKMFVCIFIFLLIFRMGFLIY